MRKLLTLGFVLSLASACAVQPPDHCGGRLGTNLQSAMSAAEERLATGCEYHFDSYFNELLDIAEANPDEENKRLFSEHLVRVSSSGTISKRQAQLLYNRYFNVKFVSFTGDYNTCAQTCPVRDEVVSQMRAELIDKQLGLMSASRDTGSYYRADQLLKETELVLEATCRSCAAAL